MKGLIFFKDGHTEEIVDYQKVDNDIYFETASSKYVRISQNGFGYIFNKITSNNHIIPIKNIQRIDLFD